MDHTRPSPVLPWELIYLIIDKVDSISPPTRTTRTITRTWMTTAADTTIPTSTNTKIQSHLFSLLLTSPSFHKPLLRKLYTQIHLTTPAQIAEYLLTTISSSNPSSRATSHTTHIYVSAPLSLSILPPPAGNPWLSSSTWTSVLSALKTLTNHLRVLQSRYGDNTNELDYPLSSMMQNLAEIEMRALFLNSHGSHGSHGSLRGEREGGEIDARYLASSDISYDTTYLSTLLIGMLFLFAPANLTEIWPNIHESRGGGECDYDDDDGDDGSVSWNFDYNLRGMLAWFCSGSEELKERIRRVRVRGYRVDRRRSAVGRPKLMFRGLDGMEGVLNVC